MHLYSFLFFFFFNDTATTEIYPLSLHDALPISQLTKPLLDLRRVGGLGRQEEIAFEIGHRLRDQGEPVADLDRKSTRLNSSHLGISYAVFCLKKKKINTAGNTTLQTYAS